MKRYIAHIDGMECGMCEAHINDLLRKKFNAAKIKTSHLRNESTFVSEEDIPRFELQFELGKLGYKLKDLREEAL